MPGQRRSSIDVEVLRSARCRGEASIPSEEDFLNLVKYADPVARVSR